MGWGLSVEWLPGRLIIERGTFRDYRELERFHYASGRPAVWAGIWRVRYVAEGGTQLVAVGVLSNPVPSCAARERALRLTSARYDRGKIGWLNRNLRTISRIIVHPQFRGVGVASALVRRMCRDSGVRYVDAFAAMGRVVPLFERGGMQRMEGRCGNAAYYLWDRTGKRH